MTDLTKLPLSITSFSQFAANSMIYVDKIFYPVRADLVNRH